VQSFILPPAFVFSHSKSFIICKDINDFLGRLKVQLKSKSCGEIKFLSSPQADEALRNFPFGTHFRSLRTLRADGELDP